MGVRPFNQNSLGDRRAPQGQTIQRFQVSLRRHKLLQLRVQDTKPVEWLTVRVNKQSKLVLAAIKQVSVSQSQTLRLRVRC